jgi:flagellar hook-associated protein 3 FlgL
MSINRVTSGVLTSQAVNYLNNNLGSLSDIQQKIAAGQNISRPSDDPVGLVRLLALSNTLRTDERYGRNIQDSIAEANTADAVMGNMADLIHRAQELTTQAANFTTSQDGRNAIALEVDQIINQLMQLGNTDIGGKYIFGGLKTDTPPFSRSGDDITYSGTPDTLAWERNVEISRGVQININTNGNELLGSVQVTTAGPPLPPTFSAGSQGLFKTLVELKQDLLAGGAANQLGEIRDRLDELTTDMNTVLSKQAIVGAVSNRLQLSQGRIDERKSILTQQFASIQDINLPSTIADLNSRQNTLDASLSVTARVLQTNLLSYLR